MLSKCFLVGIAVFVCSAVASPGGAPLVYLTAKLDATLGYCIDPIRPLTTECSLQSHTCKPDNDGEDTQFEYIESSHTIISDMFNGRCRAMGGGGGCVTANADEAGAGLSIANCDGSDLQTFTLTSSSEFAMGGGSGLCLGVGDTTDPEWNYERRDLMLVDCSTYPAELKTWTVVPATSIGML